MAAVIKVCRRRWTPCFVILTVFLISLRGNAEVTQSEYAAYTKILDLPSLVDNAAITPIWTPDGTAFIFLETEGPSKSFVRVDLASGRREAFFDIDRLRSALREVSLPAPLVLFESFRFTEDRNVIRFESQGRSFRLNLTSYRIQELSRDQLKKLEDREPREIKGYFPEAGRHVYELPSPGKDRFLQALGHNIWVRDAENNRMNQLTHDGTDRLGWGEPIGVWPFAQPAWSPDGSTIAAFKFDSRQVGYIPVVDWFSHPESVNYSLFAESGRAIPQQYLHFVDSRSGKDMPVRTGSASAFIRSVGWDPSGRYFLYFGLSRYGKSLELRSADRLTGEDERRWAEQSDTFVAAPLRLPHDPQISLLSNGRFIVSSQKDGLWQLYLYGADKSGHTVLLHQLTNAGYPIVDIIRVEEQANTIYFTAHSDRTRPYDTQLFKVRFDGSELKQLTDAPGQNQIEFAPSGDYFLDTHSTVSTPPVTDLLRIDGKWITTVVTADATRLKQIGWRAPEEFVSKSRDGKTDVYGVIQVPPNFDPAKKYPLIEYIYAGPQVSITPKTFIPNDNLAIFAQALAQLGFVVVVVDGPGTPERGKAFEDAVYGQLGRWEIPDHAAAIRYIARDRPYIDLNRVGVFGLSYGGYFAIRALLQAPDLYRVGVAASILADLHTANSFGVENYMGGGPQDVPAAYDYADSVELINHLNGNLLIMQGTSDINTPLCHALKFIDALNRPGKRYNFIAFPLANHAFEYEDRRAMDPRWFTTVRDYLVQELHP